ncbi:MAG: AAA family ATPase [Fusobacteriaceae bacterium]
MSQIAINDQLILIEGKAASGKSASFMFFDDPEGVAYMNCENGKRLPFPAKFTQVTVTDPLQVPASIEALNSNDKFHTIIVDSLSFLMQMYESTYVLPAANTMKMWGEYAQFFIRMMNGVVAKSNKTIIFTSHTTDNYNESEMVTETSATVKGSLKNVGIEAYFSCVVMARRMPVAKLETYEKGNSLLNITEQERALGFKHVFQLQLTKETINEKIRHPMGLWAPQEVYMDNNTQALINRLKQYYA